MAVFTSRLHLGGLARRLVQDGLIGEPEAVSATDEAAREHNLAGQSTDPEVATIRRDAFKDARDRARAIVLTAKDTDAQTARGEPTIVCTEVYPEPSWWPL